MTDAVIRYDFEVHRVSLREVCLECEVLGSLRFLSRKHHHPSKKRLNIVIAVSIRGTHLSFTGLAFLTPDQCENAGIHLI